MKIKLDLTNYKSELLDQTPFIQGTDTVRNKIEVYVLASVYSSITNPKISYTYPSGRSSIAIGNDGTSDVTINDVSYKNIYFNLPAVATAEAGQLMATLVLELTNGTVKFNVTNLVLKSSDFETFNNALTGAAAELLADLEAKGTAIQNINSEIGTDSTDGTIKGRIKDCEDTDTAHANGISQLNTYVFGDATGANINNPVGLVYKVAQLESAGSSDNSKILQLQNTVYGSTSGQTPAGLVSKVAAINTEIGTDATANTIKGRIKKNETDIDTIEGEISGINTEIGTNDTTGTIKGRITAIENADYQSQIDAINAGQNLADIVANLAALNSISTTNLHNGDKVQVLVDSNHSNASTVYNWTGSAWSYIGKYGQDGYTKSQEDLLLAAKENKSNKITTWGTPTDTQYPSAKLVKDDIDLLENGKADKSNVYAKSEVYTKGQVDAIISDLTVNGYAIDWEDLCDIFNEVYASDPLMTMLDSINGEVV